MTEQEMREAMRPMTPDELKARQLEQAPLMRALSEDERRDAFDRAVLESIRRDRYGTTPQEPAEQ